VLAEHVTGLVAPFRWQQRCRVGARRRGRHSDAGSLQGLDEGRPGKGRRVINLMHGQGGRAAGCKGYLMLRPA